MYQTLKSPQCIYPKYVQMSKFEIEKGTFKL